MLIIYRRKSHNSEALNLAHVIKRYYQRARKNEKIIPKIDAKDALKNDAYVHKPIFFIEYQGRYSPDQVYCNTS